MFVFLRRVIAEFISHIGRWKFIFVTFLICIISGIAMLEPIFMAKTIGFIEEFLKTGIFDMNSFLWFLVIWWFFILFNTGLNYIHRYYLSDRFALEFHNVFAKKYVKNVYFMEMRDYLSRKSGWLFKDFDRGVGAVFNIIFFLLGSAIKTTFSFVVILGILLFFHWKMTILALLMLPFMGLVGYFVGKKTTKPQTKNEEKWTQAFGVIGDFLSNMQLGKILSLEKKFQKKFYEEVDEALHFQKFTSKWWSISDMITSVFAMISRFLVIGGGVYFIMQWELTFAGLLLVFSYIEKIYYPVSWLFGSFPNLQQWNTRLEKFYNWFSQEEIEDLEKGENFSPKTGKIVFENINFSYNSERKILKNLSFEITSGQKIAFVGNTGAGKSTIVSLLFRFWEPNFGKIIIDDQNIAEVKKSDLRKHIGIVAQDNSLFNITIRENLLFAKPNATEDELKKALKKASADFVFSLEKWLDTKIGERWLKLSGWEKQRLSIARIFLKNPEILVFDEATSALDNKTEKVIQKSLDSLMKDKTTIIIAHRLSTIRNVDKIFMLENGEIIESGSYDELVAKGWKFAELADPSRLVIT